MPRSFGVEAVVGVYIQGKSVGSQVCWDQANVLRLLGATYGRFEGLLYVSAWVSTCLH